MKIILVALICSTAIASQLSDKLNSNETYLGFRHSHNGSAHKALDYISKDIKAYINKGRVNLYKITNKSFDLSKTPKFVQDQFFYVSKEDLVYMPQTSKTLENNPLVINSLKKLNVESYKNYVTSLVAIGNRSKGAEASSYLISELQKLNLTPIKTDYNIVSKIEGSTNNSIVIIGHMDTVRRTVGADDNASGASGVMEMARVLADVYKATKPKESIYFVFSEDEEDGLKGAKKFVKDLKKAGTLKNVKLAINMDMIAYNKNNVVDLETSKSFKDLALDFANKAKSYTTLTPNLVLNPWGSDHVPFIDNDIPALLTIENWKTHTPCWHKSCDTLDTLNFEYAIEILKLNIAMVLDRK